MSKKEMTNDVQARGRHALLRPTRFVRSTPLPRADCPLRRDHHGKRADLSESFSAPDRYIVCRAVKVACLRTRLHPRHDVMYARTVRSLEQHHIPVDEFVVKCALQLVERIRVASTARDR